MPLVVLYSPWPAAPLADIERNSRILGSLTSDCSTGLFAKTPGKATIGLAEAHAITHGYLTARPTAMDITAGPWRKEESLLPTSGIMP